MATYMAPEQGLSTTAMNPVDGRLPVWAPMCLTCKTFVRRVRTRYEPLKAATFVLLECHGQREIVQIPDELFHDQRGHDRIHSLLAVAFEPPEPPELLAAGW